MVASLAIFEGFWGQVFEYWPLTFLVVLTIVYVTVALGSDLLFGKRNKLPPGAEPRVEFEVDTSVIARNRFRSGLYLIRLGVWAGIVVALIFAYVAQFPLSIGAQYGLTQETNEATALGTKIGLATAVIALVCSFFLRAVPLPLIATIVLAVLVTTFAPPVVNGEMRWVGIMVTVMAIPLGLISIGTAKSLKYFTEATRQREAPQELSTV